MRTIHLLTFLLYSLSTIGQSQSVSELLYISKKVNFSNEPPSYENIPFLSSLNKVSYSTNKEGIIKYIQEGGELFDSTYSLLTVNKLGLGKMHWGYLVPKDDSIFLFSMEINASYNWQSNRVQSSLYLPSSNTVPYYSHEVFDTSHFWKYFFIDYYNPNQLLAYLIDTLNTLWIYEIQGSDWQYKTSKSLGQLDLVNVLNKGVLVCTGPKFGDSLYVKRFDGQSQVIDITVLAPPKYFERRFAATSPEGAYFYWIEQRQRSAQWSFESCLHRYSFTTGIIDHLGVVGNTDSFTVKSSLLTAPNNKLYLFDDSGRKPTTVNYPDEQIEYVKLVHNNSQGITFLDSNSSFYFTNNYNYLNWQKPFWYKTERICNDITLTAQYDSTVFTDLTWYIGCDSMMLCADSAVGNQLKLTLPFGFNGLILLRGKDQERYQYFSDEFQHTAPPVVTMDTTTVYGCRYAETSFSFNVDVDAGLDRNIYTSVSFGDGNNRVLSSKADSVFTLQHIYIQSGNYTLTVIVRDTFCTDTFVFNQKIQIQDHSRFYIKNKPNAICPPDSITLQLEKGNETGTLTINWGDGTNETFATWPNSASHQYLNEGNYAVQARFIDISGCVFLDSFILRAHSPIVSTGWDTLASIVPTTCHTWQFNLPFINSSYRFYLDFYDSSGSILSHYSIGNTKQQIDLPERTSNVQLNLIDSCGNLVDIFNSDIPQLSFSDVNADSLLLNLSALNPEYNNLFSGKSNQLQPVSGSFKFPMEMQKPDMTFFTQLCFSATAVNGFNPPSSCNCMENTPMMYVPSAFRPNGVNKLFLIKGTGFSEYHIAIYNRWGQQVYTSSTPTEGWDGYNLGKPCPNGVYTYVISFNKTYYTGTLLLLE